MKHLTIYTLFDIAQYTCHIDCGLQENLVLNYTPQSSSTFNLYNQPSPFRPHSASIRNLLAGRETSRGSFNPLHHHPTAVPVRLLSEVAPHVHKGLCNAVDEIGGISVFLFLFSKVCNTILLYLYLQRH